MVQVFKTSLTRAGPGHNRIYSTCRQPARQWAQNSYPSNSPSAHLSLAAKLIAKKLGQLLFIYCVVFSGWVSAGTVELTGQVLDATGLAVAQARVQIAGRITSTDATGRFSLQGLKSKNVLLEVAATGYRSEVLPIHLSIPGSINQVDLEPVILTARSEDTARFLFGGDSSFGRRYLDPLNQTPRDQVPPSNPEALVLSSNPPPGSRSVARFLRPFFQRADWAVVNLESPVTDEPSTPHWQKDYAFFTLPGSLEALSWLGIDYVSLGNNHVYDYLEAGVSDTILNLDAIGIFHSGAGSNTTEAFAPYRFALNGSHYSMLSMTSVAGSKHDLNYVADEDKGGAADLRDSDRVRAAIAEESNKGFTPVVQLHGGTEYSFQPTAYFMGRLKLAVASGAGLVVGHHPHVAQGVGIIDDVVTIHSLGNLIFDQARLETMLGLLARVDMTADSAESLRLIPVYVEDYQPRPISGALADRFLRRIGEFSHDYGALVYPYNGQGWVALPPESPSILDRTQVVDIVIPPEGSTIIDLRHLSGSSESLQRISADQGGLGLQLGRDLMLHGDFEDWDIDSDQLEASRWDMRPASNEICANAGLRGTAALCSSRHSKNSADSVTAFRNRIRVMGEATGKPNKELSLVGYVRGDNAGPINIMSRYYASVGSRVFGEQLAYSQPGGSFAWQQIQSDLLLPEDEAPVTDAENNPRALRIFVRHSPPASGQAKALFDDFAIVNWDQPLGPIATAGLSTPHARDFLRVAGPPGSYQLSLTFRSYKPAVSRIVAPDVKVSGKDHLHGRSDGAELAVTVALTEYLKPEIPVDWWVWAETGQGGVFSYVYPDGWKAGNRRTVRAPLFDLSRYEIFRGKLPTGSYRVHFCIDNNGDGERDCTWSDSASISLR